MSAANSFISLGLKDAGYEYGAIDHILDKYGMAIVKL